MSSRKDSEILSRKAEESAKFSIAPKGTKACVEIHCVNRTWYKGLSITGNTQFDTWKTMCLMVNSIPPFGEKL